MGHVLNPPLEWERVVNGKRYSIKTATLLASDHYWDGSNFDRGGRNRWLYRTPKGAYFLVTMSMWQGERDHLEPVSQEEAIQLYEHELSEHDLDYERAFPGVTVEEA